MTELEAKFVDTGIVFIECAGDKGKEYNAST